MCPVCIATAAFVTTGTVSAGGMVAIVVKKIRSKERPDRSDSLKTQQITNKKS